MFRSFNILGSCQEGYNEYEDLHRTRGKYFCGVENVCGNIDMK